MEIPLKRLNIGCSVLIISWIIVTADNLSLEHKDKKAIVYQGSTFLVTGGCKAPQCNSELEECQRIQNAFENLYSYCKQSAHGSYPACLRSKSSANTAINVPIYASVCDALCHESEPEKLQTLTVCESTAVQDEELSNHFNTLFILSSATRSATLSSFTFLACSSSSIH